MLSSPTDTVYQKLEPVKGGFLYFPQASSLEVCSGESWNSACSTYAFPVSGMEFYIPRKKAAFVRDSGNIGENVRMAAHGFVGHGSFCEFSNLGNEYVKLDMDAADIEKYLFGGTDVNDRFLLYEAPVGKPISIPTSGVDFCLRTRIESDGKRLEDYGGIVIANPHDVASYKKVRDAIDGFKRSNMWKYEGFAMLIEEFVLDCLKMEDAKQRLISSLRGGNHEYAAFYSEVKKIEGESGFGGVLKFMGFGD